MDLMTWGVCKASMHDVVVSTETLREIKLAKEQNRCLWRVSSMLFVHSASTAILQPLGPFQKAELASNYPAICADRYVQQELATIIDV
ncbi:hypothetical protein TSUD_387580 [Trifolium subterraneum]|uniref:Uncharacterized protein n=1 Tax=Trifolium subterraneum TaxID=3900 RepID=A0A2Z6MXL1_TRISU|nr:hypothetical protein TSUD_387580 [Trifolium subterraneum]